MGVSVNGSQTAQFNAGNIRSNVQLLAATNDLNEIPANARPTIAWSQYPDSGFHMELTNDEDIIHTVINGVKVGATSPTETSHVVALSAPTILADNGTIAAPSHTFFNAVDSGMSIITGPPSLSISHLGDEAIKVVGSDVQTIGTHIFARRDLDPNPLLAQPTISFDGLQNGFNNNLTVGTGIIQTVIAGEQVAGCSSTELSHTVAMVAPTIFSGDGSVSGPGHSFSSFPTSGLFHTASVMGLSHNGTTQLSLDTPNNTVNVNSILSVGTQTRCSTIGTVAPAYSFTGDTDSGFFSAGANLVGLATAGVDRLTASATDITTSVPLRLFDGTAAAPALSFIGSTGLGLYRSNTNVLSFSTGGVDRLTLSLSSLSSTLPYIAPVGSIAAPSYSFASDASSGMFRSGVNTIAFTTGGTQRLSIGSTAATSTIPITVPVGAVGAPSMNFAGDLTTGIFRSAASTVAVGTAGVSRLTISDVAVASTLPVFLPIGTLAAPGLVVNTLDVNTGFTQLTGALDTITGTCGGVRSMQLEATKCLLGTGAGSWLTTATNTTCIGTAQVQGTSAATASNNILIGNATGYNGNGGTGSHILVGNSARTGNGTNTCILGHSSSTNGNDVTLVGNSISGNNGGSCVAVGTSISMNGADCTAIGANTNTGNSTGSTILGKSSTTTTNNTTILGQGITGNVTDALFFRPTTAALTAGGSVVTMLFNTTTGQAGPTASSIRFKENVSLAPTTSTAELSPFDRIRVVEYTQKSDDTSTPQIGLIAEELAEHVHPSIIPRDDKGDPISVRYDLLVCTLIQEVQALRREVAILKGTPLPDLPAYVPVDETQIYPPEKRFCEKLAQQKQENCDLRQELRAEKIFQEILQAPESKEERLAELCESLKTRVEAKITKREAETAPPSEPTEPSSEASSEPTEPSEP
jgi:hypothetical protein